MRDIAAVIKSTKSDRKKGARKKAAAYAYKNIVITFDIETSRLHDTEDNSIMYIWQCYIEGMGAITGRTWDEFINLLDGIGSGLKSFERVIIYVHNLSFEFSFLKGILDFSEVFFIKPRKVLYAVYDQIEFRCSYFLTNMKLEKFLEQMNVEHKKLTYNYDKVRYPWTHLSDVELDYCLNDVIGLAEAIRIRLDNDGDTLATIPYTSTGYIRRDAKKAYNKLSYWGRREIMPPYGLYRMLRTSFRGGNCHANRWYADQIITEVYSFDRASSYPDVMLNCPFPVSSFYHTGACSSDKMLELLRDKEKAIIMKVIFKNIHLKDRMYPIPYIARFNLEACRRPVIIDNGRILEAGEIELTITDIDFKIIDYQYEYDEIIITDLYYARYGNMKRCIKELIIRDYIYKTSLKGGDNDYLYARSKERINAYYGMTAQDPVKDNLIYVGGDEVCRYEGREAPELLEQTNKKAFLPYQIGVWVTAWARYRLEQGIKIVHENKGTVLYVDTDSVKFTDINDDIIKGFEAFNKKAAEASIKSGITALDIKGIEHPAGVYEKDGQYKRFKTMGAKKYVYEDETGLHITIAGVEKKAGAAELGKIENFKEGFTFIKAGGLEAVYHDNINEDIIIEGHKIKITDNVTLRPSTYTLGLTQDYKDLLYMLSNEIFFNDFL